jgi:hypothetical protein
MTARAGLYWRRGARVTPGVMTLEAGVLSFATEHEEVFRAPVSEVRAEFTRYSTLVITAAGARQVFVTGAYAGTLAPPFTDRQLAELAGADAVREASARFARGAAIVSGAAIATSALGRVFGLVGQAVGVVELTRANSDSFALSKAWAEYLASNGVSLRMRGTTYARSYWFLAAIIVPAFAVFGVGVYFVLDALQR